LPLSKLVLTTFRDARCGRFHPANTFLIDEIVAKTALGIDVAEQPPCG
jgi:hypothetical protein